MSLEQNPPQAQPQGQPQQQGPGPIPGAAQGAGPGQGPGPGQFKRRRRRRNKGKNGASAQGAGPNGGQNGSQGAGLVNGQPGNGQVGQPVQQAQPFVQNNFAQNKVKKSDQQQRFFKKQNQGGGGQGNGQANGNFNGNGNGQGGSRKRNGKQRRQQVFVGPMDHSYRVANGNVADAPPSTMDFHQNGHQDYNSGYSSNEYGFVPGVVREDSPTRVYFFIEDLFFFAKINEVARKLGVKVAFVKNDKETLAKLTDCIEEERPALIVFDLNNLNAKPLTVIPKLKAKLKKSVSIIGFLSHLQGDLKAKAIEAGCDTVMPRAAFSQGLPNLLRRYGMEDDEELDSQLNWN